MKYVAMLVGLALVVSTGCNSATSKCEEAVELAQTNESHFFTAATACGDACTETDDHAICMLTDALFGQACRIDEGRCAKLCTEAPSGTSKDKACQAVDQRKLGRAARVTCDAAVKAVETAMGVLDHGSTMTALGDAAKACAAACAADTDICATTDRLADSLCALDSAECKTRCESEPPEVSYRFCERAGLRIDAIENPLVNPGRLCGRAGARYGVLADAQPGTDDTRTALRQAITWCDISCEAGRKGDCENMPKYVETACADRPTCKALCDLDRTSRPSSKMACARLIDAADPRPAK